MFKAQGQTRARSPYQPKLLQALIDSSDEENLSMESNEEKQQDFSQEQQSEDRSEARKSQYTNLFPNNDEKNMFSNDDRKSVHSVYTSMSHQTIKARPSADFNQTKNPKQSNLSSIQPNTSKPEVLNLTRFTQSKQSKPQFGFEKQISEILPRKQVSEVNKGKSSHSPNIAIKYDTLKLSEYSSKEIKKQDQLYKQNLKDFREKFCSQKSSLHQNQTQNNNILLIQKKTSINQCVDSLEEMQKSNLNKRHFSRKSLKNQVSTPSSRINFLKEQKEVGSNEKQDQIHLVDGNSEIERLRQELKRSKDVIRTLGLKNADLQKSLEMKNIKIQELQMESSSQVSKEKKKVERQEAERKVYGRVNSYMKERIKQFMDEIKTTKMSPLLQNSLEGFLAQILQLNPATVQKKIGTCQDEAQKQELRIPLKEGGQNATPNRLSKSIFNSKNEADEKEDNHFQMNANKFQNRFKTAAYPQSHIVMGTTRQNAFIMSKDNNQGQNPVTINGYSVKIDLSSNKENITPNKKAGEENNLRQLEKSLQKLNAMEKQLLTPLPKNLYVTNKSHFVSNNEEYRSEYSIINRSNLSVMGKEENSSMSMSGNNLDRSKSRRKKIFADAHPK